MRWMPPWDDWGREWLEWVDDDETEFERECIGRKSRFVGIICMLTAVIWRSSKRWWVSLQKGGGSGPAPENKEGKKEKKVKRKTSVQAPRWRRKFAQRRKSCTQTLGRRR
jgi:hypothetical protein